VRRTLSIVIFYTGSTRGREKGKARVMSDE
jgi:hypothetical protein